MTHAKKIALIFLTGLLTVIPVYAEQALSFSGGFLCTMNAVKSDGKRYQMGFGGISLNAQYDYVFPFGLMLGITGEASAGSFSFQKPTGGYGTLISQGASTFWLAPVIGFRFGHSHFHSVSVMPIEFVWMSTFANSAAVNEVVNNNVNYSKEYPNVENSERRLDLKSGVRFSFEWGGDVNKNGFTFGVNVPWGVKYTSNNLSLDMTGFDIYFGYRHSWMSQPDFTRTSVNRTVSYDKSGVTNFIVSGGDLKESLEYSSIDEMIADREKIVRAAKKDGTSFFITIPSGSSFRNMDSLWRIADIFDGAETLDLYDDGCFDGVGNIIVLKVSRVQKKYLIVSVSGIETRREIDLRKREAEVKSRETEIQKKEADVKKWEDDLTVEAARQDALKAEREANQNAGWGYVTDEERKIIESESAKHNPVPDEKVQEETSRGITGFLGVTFGTDKEKAVEYITRKTGLPITTEDDTTVIYESDFYNDYKYEGLAVDYIMLNFLETGEFYSAMVGIKYSSARDFSRTAKNIIEDAFGEGKVSIGAVNESTMAVLDDYGRSFMYSWGSECFFVFVDMNSSPAVRELSEPE